jgi:uncharacterized phage protein (TIGR01671 family)
MTRTIKCRAWNLDEKKMEYGDGLVRFTGVIHELEDYIKRPAIHGTRISRMFNGEIMQSTSLLDKNGREIYEGDILTAIQGEQEKPTTEYQVKDVVRWYQGGFEVFGRAMNSCYTAEKNQIREWIWHTSSHLNIPAMYYRIKEVEIIGNIYENPELIKTN